ncbi:MAG: phosphate/phosphite/phosphonate ABC transporter substrate-binding protein [Oligoflexia bacterium]|nr:phosphate/phosphite/phosphonate ABC transporter substrate-binding protein [Oligoflexia bacterium]
MFIRLLFAFALLLVFSHGPAVADGRSPSAVTVGFIPGENPEWLKKNAAQLAKVLQNKLHIPFKVYISKDYNGLTDAMASKKLDFAFFSARTFVDAEQRAGAKPLLKKVWDSPFYFSAIIVPKNSPIKKMRDLKGKVFGFVDDRSASGYLFPMVEFNKSGLEPKTAFKEVKFFGNHDASVRGLLDGKADAVAVFADNVKGTTGAWTKFYPKESDKVRVIWVSNPIPNDPFCVRQDFYEQFPQFTHDVMFTLIDMKDEPADKNILKTLFGVTSLELATSRQYDPVRELVKYLESANEKNK